MTLNEYNSTIERRKKHEELVNAKLKEMNEEFRRRTDEQFAFMIKESIRKDIILRIKNGLLPK